MKAEGGSGRIKGTTARLELELLRRAIEAKDKEFERLGEVLEQMRVKQARRISEFFAQRKRLIKGGA